MSGTSGETSAFPPTDIPWASFPTAPFTFSSTIISVFGIIWNTLISLIQPFLDYIAGIINFLSSVFTGDWLLRGPSSGSEKPRKDLILSATPFTASPTLPTAPVMPLTIASMMSAPH